MLFKHKVKFGGSILLKSDVKYANLSTRIDNRLNRNL